MRYPGREAQSRATGFLGLGPKGRGAASRIGSHGDDRSDRGEPVRRGRDRAAPRERREREHVERARATQQASVGARLASPFGSMVKVQAVTVGGRRAEQAVFVGERGAQLPSSCGLGEVRSGRAAHAEMSSGQVRDAPRLPTMVRGVDSDGAAEVAAHGANRARGVHGGTLNDLTIRRHIPRYSHELHQRCLIPGPPARRHPRGPAAVRPRAAGGSGPRRRRPGCALPARTRWPSSTRARRRAVLGAR